MSLSEYTKLSIAFKKLIARDHSIVDKAWYEEEPGGGFNIHATEVWAEAVPPTPPGATTSIIKVYTDLADGAIKLTEDVTVSGSRGWYAEDGARIGDFVPAKFGQGYTAKIYQGNGAGGIGSQIFTTNPVAWFFDEVSGYLALQNFHSFITPLWLEAYRYIGDKVSDQLGGAPGEDKTVGDYDCDVALTVSKLVRVNTISNKAVLASSSGGNLGAAVGVCIEKPTSTTCKVRFIGECEVFAGLVAGTDYFLGVDGALTTTPAEGAATIHQHVGVSKNAATLVFRKGEAVFN